MNVPIIGARRIRVTVDIQLPPDVPLPVVLQQMSYTAFLAQFVQHTNVGELPTVLPDLSRPA